MKFPDIFLQRYNVTARGVFGANLGEISALCALPEIAFDYEDARPHQGKRETRERNRPGQARHRSVHIQDRPDRTDRRARRGPRRPAPAERRRPERADRGRPLRSDVRGCEGRRTDDQRARGHPRRPGARRAEDRGRRAREGAEGTPREDPVFFLRDRLLHQQDADLRPRVRPGRARRALLHGHLRRDLGSAFLRSRPAETDRIRHDRLHSAGRATPIRSSCG